MKIYEFEKFKIPNNLIDHEIVEDKRVKNRKVKDGRVEDRIIKDDNKLNKDDSGKEKY